VRDAPCDPRAVISTIGLPRSNISNMRQSEIDEDLYACGWSSFSGVILTASLTATGLAKDG
jgi:hypothetical protein